MFVNVYLTAQSQHIGGRMRENRTVIRQELYTTEDFLTAWQDFRKRKNDSSKNKSA